MKISFIKRISKTYKSLRFAFGAYFTPIITGLLLLSLRLIVQIGMFVDYIFYPIKIKNKIVSPIIIVGNPRSGTTFLHRYLVNNKVGSGSQLWQLIYTSVTLQKIIRPVLPLLEYFSPTKHHSTEAHKTSLSSIETDDASMLFRYFDGFFLYGFILSWSKENLFDWIDPRVRNTSDRDCAYYNERWIRVLQASGDTQFIGKLFSVSADIPSFLKRFPCLSY